MDQEPLREGQDVLGRYRLQRIIGEGGMGVVWAAHDSTADKVVALKFLRAEGADQARYVHRLMREARVMSQLVHPNIAKVYGAFETDNGTPFLVMDLLRGEPLSARLARGALCFDDAAKIVGQVVAAIETTHRAGIVHRDLKPENIFLEENDTVRVLDFGIAKVTNLPSDELSLTATGAMLGTPYYMSPEQIFGDDDVDHRADVWALGVVLYECLAGVRPTQASGVGQVIKIIMNEAIVPLRERVVVTPELDAMVHRMLSRDRMLRPSLEEIRTTLDGLRGTQGRASGQIHSGEVATLDSVELGGSPVRKLPRKVAKRARSRAWLWGAVAAPLLLALVVVQGASAAIGAREGPMRTFAGAQRTLRASSTATAQQDGPQVERAQSEEQKLRPMRALPSKNVEASSPAKSVVTATVSAPAAAIVAPSVSVPALPASTPSAIPSVRIPSRERI